MPAASPGGNGEEQERVRKLADFAESAERRLLGVLERRKKDDDGDSNACRPTPAVSSPGWLDAAAVARSRGPVAAARLMVESHKAWESRDEAVVRAVARLAVAASGTSGEQLSADDADVADVTASASLAALPRALAALGASRDRILAGGALPQLVEAVEACSSAITLYSSAAAAPVPLLEGNANAALLAAAAAAAAAPPPEALFASVGGDPTLSSRARLCIQQEDEADESGSPAAAEEWRARARACVSAAGAAVAAVGVGALPSAAAKPPPARPRPPPPPPPPPPPASSLWDITGRSSRHSSILPSASAVAAAGARDRGPLIEVIDDGGSDGGDGGSDGKEEGKRDEEDASEDDKARAAAAAAEAAEASALEEAQAQALRLAALYTRDEELGCSWANSDDGDGGDEEGNADDGNGDTKRPAPPSFPFLSDSEPLPIAAARLLPRAIGPLHSCLTASKQEGRDWNRGGIDAVRVEPNEGPGVFERAAAAYSLGVMLRWILSDRPGPRSGPTSDSSSVLSDVSVALPALLAAADDPSPAVARIGLLSLSGLAWGIVGESSTRAGRGRGGGGLCLERQHAAEASLLAAAARRAALGSDERAASAATAAASALAVALDDDGGFDDDGVAGEGDGSFRDRRPAECCSSVFSDLLDDAQRHSHESQRSARWLLSTRPLFERMGLAVAPALSGRVLPLLARWMLLSTPTTTTSRKKSSGFPPLHLPREAALTLLTITRRAWPRVGAHVHALPLWSATALAFEREEKRRSKGRGGDDDDDDHFRRSLLELAGAVRAAAAAVAAAASSAAGDDLASRIDESLAGVDGGSALLEALREEEEKKEKTLRERL